MTTKSMKKAIIRQGIAEKISEDFTFDTYILILGEFQLDLISLESIKIPDTSEKSKVDFIEQSLNLADISGKWESLLDSLYSRTNENIYIWAKNDPDDIL